MRILFLLPTLTGAGAERQTAYLAKELQQRGHDVLTGYIYYGAGEWPSDVPSHRLAARWSWSPLLIRDILRLVHDFQPDVVQTCLRRMDVAGAVAATIGRVPLVVREPNTASSYDGFGSRLRIVAGSSADAVIANSRAGASYWSHARTFVVPNAVPLEAIERATPVDRPDHELVAVYTGRLVREKNVDIVLRAAAAVMANRDLFLFVCGDGPERDRLVELSRELGIDGRVRFTGFVANPWSYQRAADVALLLSDHEGHPNAVSECLASGIPMVLSDIAPHREVAGPHAWFVPPRDVSATANALRDILENRRDAAERSARAREGVRNWPIVAMADAYEAVYSSIAGGGRASAPSRS